MLLFSLAECYRVTTCWIFNAFGNSTNLRAEEITTRHHPTGHREMVLTCIFTGKENVFLEKWLQPPPLDSPFTQKPISS